MDKHQKKIFQWILFATILILFLLISGLTINEVFFAKESHLTDEERKLLFNTFLLTVGTSLIALFYDFFGLGGKTRYLAKEYKIRLNFEALVDIRSFFGKGAICTPILKNNEVSDDILCFIIDDVGPVITITPPKTSKFVLISFDVNNATYSGSFALDSYLVDMVREE